MKKKNSISKPKHHRVSFDHLADEDEEQKRPLSPGPRLRASFDITEHEKWTTRKRTYSMKSEPSKSRHGFFSEFEIIQPQPIQKTYSLHSLLPGPEQTYKEKYNCKVSTFFPILQWLPHYELAWLKPDLMAGITVSILQVPQVLAYAVLAGLPPEWGLYASVIPVIVYAIWSTSTKVAVGPGAPAAIMLASACNGVIAHYGLTVEDAAYAETYQEIAMTFTFCCAVVFLTLGILRAGFVIVFLSMPVMTGFIMSASFIIVLSQCKGLFGLDIGRYSLFYENLIAVIQHIDTIHWWTTLISMLSLLVLFLPKFFPRIPRWVPIPLIVMVVNILLSYLLDFESLGVETVGAEISAGFPGPKLPNFKHFGAVFPSALIVTVVDYMSNIMLAKGFEQKNKDEYQQQLHAYNSYMKHSEEEREKAAAAAAGNRGEMFGIVEHDGSSEDEDADRDDKALTAGVLDTAAAGDASTGTKPLEPGAAGAETKTGKGSKEGAGHGETPATSKSKDKAPERPLSLPPLDVSANMEFFAYGLANLLGSLFSAQLISASFSRTALNAEMAGHTRVAGFIRVVLCVLCLLFLMPYLSPLPKCVLAAVVCTAVYRLIKSGVSECFFLWKVSKLELIEFGVAAIAPLVIGMEMGIFLSIATSIIVNLLRHTFANVVFLGRLETKHGEAEYVAIESFKQAKPVPFIQIIEMKAELSFSNNLRMVDKIRSLLADGNRYILVSLNLTSFIDTTAIRSIVTLFEDAKESYICLSQCRPRVVELIRRYQRSTSEFPPNVKTFVSTNDAVRFLEEKRQEQSNYSSDDNDDVELSSIHDKHIIAMSPDPSIPPPTKKFSMHLSPAPNMLVPPTDTPDVARI